MTPHMLRAVELLSDGQEMDRDEVILEMGKAIPPGVAIRYQDKVRLQRRQQHLKNGKPTLRETPERIIEREKNTLILMGRRAMALKALHTARRIQQRKGVDGRMYVRLRPGYARGEAPVEERQEHRERRAGESNSVGLSPEAG